MLCGYCRKILPENIAVLHRKTLSDNVVNRRRKKIKTPSDNAVNRRRKKNKNAVEKVRAKIV